jgi:hypothetical protein
MTELGSGKVKGSKGAFGGMFLVSLATGRDMAGSVFVQWEPQIWSLGCHTHSNGCGDGDGSRTLAVISFALIKHVQLMILRSRRIYRKYPGWESDSWF